MSHLREFTCPSCSWKGLRGRGAAWCPACKAPFRGPPIRQSPLALRLRAALLRIAARCDNWSPADVRAAVADALGMKVEDLDKE